MKIYGPKGNPDAPPGTTRYTKVPYEIIEALDREAQKTKGEPADTKLQPGSWDLRDKRVDIGSFHSCPHSTFLICAAYSRKF